MLGRLAVEQPFPSDFSGIWLDVCCIMTKEQGEPAILVWELPGKCASSNEVICRNEKTNET